MRFIHNGPSIPDELLIARDEGRVVFFCGAGVSRAFANLPDFFGLADDVIKKLGVPKDHPVLKVLNEAREIQKRTNEDGLISADRIFGLLERDFEDSFIYTAVTEALKPNKKVDLSAHQTLLDLATTQEGKVRLVTTNFDRLFDDCSNDFKVWKPPRLPDLSLNEEMDGVVYLHGCSNKEYTESDGEGFILSSSQFGRAYLADGWATSFFKEILSRYIVVFIGYSADDPPVQYLLEALNKKEGKQNSVFAFQSGLASNATSRWYYKGVEAIPFDDYDKLWNTLDKWAIRAKDPEKWQESIVKIAKKGPEALKPYVRGQVAHLVSTDIGAKKFAEGDSPPSAEWLCVFDPYTRFAIPSSGSLFNRNAPLVDPFDLYGLDSDEVPNEYDPDNPFKGRNIPENSWDAFKISTLDYQDLPYENHIHFRGYSSTNFSNLPTRLRLLGEWISKVAHQSAAIWWAVRQDRLHPNIQKQIRWELERRQKNISPIINDAWKYLFEAWELEIDEYSFDWYNLNSILQNKGWSNSIVRNYSKISRPYLIVEKAYGNSVKPIKDESDLRVSDLISLRVKYSLPSINIEISELWLPNLISEYRKNLEYASSLETEILNLNGYSFNKISTFYEDNDPNIHNDDQELSGYVLSFYSHFLELVKLDIILAKKEFLAWPDNDDRIFSRLRVAASGIEELVPIKSFSENYIGFPDNVFWDLDHQRDLLIVLAKRWSSLKITYRKKIEARILKGPPQRENEEKEKFTKRKAWAILERITWLASQGCIFSFDLDTKVQMMCKIVPDWKDHDVSQAIDSHEGRSGYVRTDTDDYVLLLHEPLDNIISVSKELNESTEDFFVEKDPFAGLSKEKPFRAFSTLTHEAKKGLFPEWAWRAFLLRDERENDSARFMALIAERLVSYSDQSISPIVDLISSWLLNISKKLVTDFPETFERIFSKLISVVISQPKLESTAINKNAETRTDWVMEALNAPIGKLAQAIFYDPRQDGLKTNEGFPKEWISLVEKLLSLGGELYLQALVIFTRSLNWFYSIDPKWTEKHLLSILDNSDENSKDAFWAGFLWRAKVPNRDLFLRLKPNLIEVTREYSQGKQKRNKVFAGLLLAGWGSKNEKTKNRLISNSELRDLLLKGGNSFRLDALIHIKRWSHKNEEGYERWRTLMLELLNEVWPRQKIVKNPVISTHLCNLAFINEDKFPKVVKIILPLLTVIDRHHLNVPFFSEDRRDTVVDKFPNETLELLYKVLPENAVIWQYGIEDMLKRISEANSNLSSDGRLIELKRRLNTR